jgi:hypothetical protein
LIVYVKQSQKKSDFAFFDCDFAYLFLLRVWQEGASQAPQQRKTFSVNDLSRTFLAEYKTIL